MKLEFNVHVSQLDQKLSLLLFMVFSEKLKKHGHERSRKDKKLYCERQTKNEVDKKREQRLYHLSSRHVKQQHFCN